MFIVGTYVGDERAYEDVAPIVRTGLLSGWNPQDWVLGDFLQSEEEIADRANYELTQTERRWVHAWSEFVSRLRELGVPKLPGFPIWADAFVHEDDLVIDAGDSCMEGQLPA